jgi:small ligand-binding sensory domain FIST
MTNIGVSYTVLPEARAAANYLVNGARTGLTNRPSLAILFATADYDTQALVSGVQEELGTVPIWGGSSMNGVFANDHWISAEKGAAALMLIADRPAGAAVNCVEDDPVAAGTAATLAAVQQAGGAASAILTLAFMGPEEKLLEGVAKAAPGVPVVGGTASDASGRFCNSAMATSKQTPWRWARWAARSVCLCKRLPADRPQGRGHARAGTQAHRTRSPAGPGCVRRVDEEPKAAVSVARF